MRIFVDANILFSAAKSDGAIRKLLKMLLHRKHACVIDGYVYEEARRNLAAKAPEGIAWLGGFLPRLVQAGASPFVSILLADFPLDEKDRPVLEAAIYHRCQFLVTGDRTHLGALFGKTVQGVAIRSPRGLAEELL